MTIKIFTGVLAILSIINIGCESDLINQNNTPSQDDNTPVVLDREAAKDTYLAAKENDTGPQTYDKILAEIALEVPSYGGALYRRGWCSQRLSLG